MQIFDLTLAPNQTRQLEAHGTYFYYYDGGAGGADATVSIKEDTGGSNIILKPGQAYRLPDSSRPAVRWSVSNYTGGGTIIGRVVIGSGEITDNRVTGSVEVIDGEKARTMAGGNYYGQPYTANVAGQYPFVQLYNPVGSGKNLIVQDVMTQSGNLVGGNMYMTNAAPWANDLSSVRIQNKKGGAPVGAAQVRMKTSATYETFPLGLMNGLAMQAGVLLQLNIKGSIVVPPGYGLCVVATLVNVDLGANFQWYEDPI